MTQTLSYSALAADPSQQKQELLLALHQSSCAEASWRRTAGYRTVILGLAYCGLFLVVVAYLQRSMLMPLRVRLCLAAVIALASLFGAGYLVGNYKSYTAALGRMRKVEEYLGAFDSNFLGALGALMSPEDRVQANLPLQRDLVSLWSVICLAAGGLGTALAVLLM